MLDMERVTPGSAAGESGESRAHGETEAQNAGTAAQALVAATAQIGLALQDSQQPVAELGSLIVHLSETLGLLHSARFAPDDSVSAATVRGLIEQLQSDVFKAIQRLQFYDRMVQHLSHLQDYLLSVANQLTAAGAPGAQREAWDEIHSKLRSRLISDAQRGLLDLFLTPDAVTKVSAQVKQPELSAPGSLELF
jgi:hypothetical protein